MDLEMGVVRASSSESRRPRASLHITPEAASVTPENVAEAIHDIVAGPIPASVNTPASLRAYVEGRLQGALGGAVVAGMTFGAFRGLGSLAEHTAAPAYLSQLASQMASVGIGGAVAGVGNPLAIAVVAPVAVALLSHLMGRSTALAPVDPEDIVPHDAPDREGQIAEIRDQQSRFGVDSLINIVSGVVSFGGLQAARSGATANADLSPGVGYALGTATSFVAGGLTAFITQTVQSMDRARIKLADGTETSVKLFHDSPAAPPDVSAAFNKAKNAFMGGREGKAAIAHLVSQVMQRGAIVAGSTVAYGALEAAIPATRDALIHRGQSASEANRNASATMAAVGFTAAVICYFTLLGKIAKTLPKPSAPVPAAPAGGGAASAAGPADAGATPTR